MDESPSINGRKPDGTFAPNNKGGPGNPHNGPSQKFRAMVYECVTEEDFKAVIAQLVALARSGEDWAVKEFLDRVLGKSRQTVDVNGALDLIKLYAKEAPAEQV